MLIIQYGRWTIPAHFRLIDVLEGNTDVDNEEDIADDDGKDEQTTGTEEKADGKKKRKKKEHSTSKGRKKIKMETPSKKKMTKGPDDPEGGLVPAKIKAFVDIGHGLGIQVLQTAWTMGVPSRGVELIKDRHRVSENLRDAVLETLRTDPPDSTLVELKCADFSKAVIPDQDTNKRDDIQRSFLLLEDKPELQDGLVIFANNALEVFSARSNLAANSECLDSCLAKLFANMVVGGRIVTLTDISGYLGDLSEWFRKDTFDSGRDAVSWGGINKSFPVFVLTKVTDKWYCQNNKCCHLQMSGAPAPNLVVDENGDLNRICVYCGEPMRRKGARFRTKRVIEDIEG